MSGLVAAGIHQLLVVFESAHLRVAVAGAEHLLTMKSPQRWLSLPS